MSGHTSGPWWVVSGGSGEFDSIDSSLQTVATNVSARDAHLIACAPKMLDALKLIAELPGFEPHEPYGFLVTALIREAEAK